MSPAVAAGVRRSFGQFLRCISGVSSDNQPAVFTAVTQARIPAMKPTINTLNDHEQRQKPAAVQDNSVRPSTS